MTTVYRGVALRSSDLPVPVEELTGQHVLDHMANWLPKIRLKNEQPGLGGSWTTRRSLAEEATNRSGYDIKAILTADVPDDIIDHESTARNNQHWPSEREITVRRGFPVPVTAVHISPVGATPQWRSLPMEPSIRTAGIRQDFPVNSRVRVKYDPEDWYPDYGTGSVVGHGTKFVKVLLDKPYGATYSNYDDDPDYDPRPMLKFGPQDLERIDRTAATGGWKQEAYASSQGDPEKHMLKQAVAAIRLAQATLGDRLAGRPVKQENYKTCFCGNTYKGGLALANHSAKCDAAKVGTAFQNWCLDNNQKLPSPASLQNQYDDIRAALIQKGYLTADGEVNYERGFDL